MDWASLYARGLAYTEFLDRYAKPAHRERWQAAYDRVALNPGHQHLLSGFERRMHLLCLAGTWCGDCVRQGSILQRIAEATPTLGLRFLDRDDEPALQDALVMNQGRRIPVVVFLSEDFEECGRFGDRTLSTYRRMAHDRLGPSCPTGILAPTGDELDDVMDDWLREIERVQLLLRLSPRLRASHND